MFNVNNEDTKIPKLRACFRLFSDVSTGTDFTPFSSVSTADFD